MRAFFSQVAARPLSAATLLKPIERYSSTPLSADEKRIFTFAWVLACVAFSYGFFLGDVTSTEATAILADTSGPASRWGWLWSFVPIDRFWIPIAVRTVSTLSLVALAWMLARAIKLGPIGTMTACIAFLVSPITIWIGGQATDEAFIALLFIAALSLPSIKRSQNISRLLRGAFVFGAYLLLVDPVLRSGHFDAKDRWLFPPLFVAAFGLPAGILLSIAPTRLWPEKAEAHHRVATTSLILMAISVALAFIVPGRWPIAAIFMALSSAGIVGAIVELWRDQQLPAVATRRLKDAVRLIAYALPAGIVIAGVIRIGTVYQYMERVEAAVIAAIVLLCMTPALIRRHLASGANIAICAILIVKLTWCHALLPERDRFHSSRMFANAIAKVAEPGTAIHTDLPVDSAFRWYVGRPVKSLAMKPESSAVVLAPEGAKLQGEIAARFLGSPFGPVKVYQVDQPGSVVSMKE